MCATREEIDRVLALTLHHFQRVDVWINNAGHGILDSVAQVDMAACRDTFETNFFGALSAMQAVIPVMRQQGFGAIINISSVAGHIPLPFHAIYSATKFALNAIGKAARSRTEKRRYPRADRLPGLRAHGFQRECHQRKRTEDECGQVRFGESARNAWRMRCLRGYLKKKREVIVPWTMHPMVKLYQLFPGLVEWAMARMAKPAK